MKKGYIQITYDDQGRVGTKVAGDLSYSDLLAGMDIVKAQVLAKMGITAPGKNPILGGLDVRNVA